MSGAERHREQKPGEKLTRNVSRQKILARSKSTLNSQLRFRKGIAYSRAVEYIEIGPQGPAQEPSPARKYTAAAENRGDGDHEAERRPGSPAVKARHGRSSIVSAHPRDVQRAVLKPPSRPEGADAAQRRTDILGKRGVFYNALPCRECGGKYVSVQKAF